jgi:cellulose synthase/poly-beta-1,6-N-acetylglucosamine synthase-like glycosyltransferase
VSTVFWAAAALVAWTYGGFPLWLVARAWLVPRPLLPRADRAPRSATVLIAAHNEEAAIAGKITNVLGLQWIGDPLQLVVASDGSTDATVERARQAGGGSPRVEVLDLPRVGKAGALNAAAARATGAILVFTDANSELAVDAVEQLLAPFADPEVGGVAGDQRYRGSQERHREGERDYWDLDRQLKMAESAAGNVISATGALYAIRRELFLHVPDGVTDDFVTSTAVIEQGRRLVFAPGAVAWEPPAATAGLEFERKVRVMTRGLRGVVVRRRLLDPRRSGAYALQLLTHKLLRRLMVVPLAALLVSSVTLTRRSRIYRAAALAQGATYGLGIAGLLAGDRPLARHRLVRLPAFFCLVNAAAARALWNVITGRRIDRWDPRRAPTPRSEGES